MATTASEKGDPVLYGLRCSTRATGCGRVTRGVVRSGDSTWRQRRPIFRAATWLALTILAALAAPAAEPKPTWAVAEAPLRVVFSRAAADAYALCTLPPAAGTQAIAAVKAVADGVVRPSRIVWADAQAVHALVDCADLPASAVVAVYGVAGEKRAVPQANGVTDATPIRIAARRSVGQDAPATLQDLKLLALRPGRRPEFFTVAGFDDVKETIGKYAKGGGWNQPLSLVRLTTWMYVPQEAHLVFALQGDTAAWLQIDSEEAVGQGYSRGRTTRQESRSLTLTPGLHRLILDLAVRYAYDLDVLWRPADGSTVEPLFVTGGSAIEGRLEHREDELHLFAHVRRGAPYRFLGTPAIFCDLTLQDGSVCWKGCELEYEWKLNDALIGSGQTLNTVLVTSNGTPAVVDLTVRRPADGTHSTTTLTLPPDTVPAVEFRVSSALIGIPAVCYGEDPVVPEIEVRATSPDIVTFNVRTEVVARNGTVAVSEQPLTLVRSWGCVALPPDEADAFREIRWQIVHAGVTIDSGRWVFETPPFDGLPDGVGGVSLLRNGAGLTLIARRASQGESHLFKGLHRSQRLLFLDGFVAPEGVADRTAAQALDRALANGPDGISVTYQRIALRSLEDQDDPRGVSRLAPLASLRDLLPVDVVLFAPDLSGARDGETPELFERRLAAFAGALFEAGKTQVILVAPPAFDVLPGCGCLPGDEPCPHARAGRLYAEIVYRVADAYGLSVADLYTPFALDKGPEPLLGSGILTPVGLKKAADVFRQLLYR